MSQPPYSYLELVGSQKNHKYVMYTCDLHYVIELFFCVCISQFYCYNVYYIFKILWKKPVNCLRNQRF